MKLKPELCGSCYFWLRRWMLPRRVSTRLSVGLAAPVRGAARVSAVPRGIRAEYFTPEVALFPGGGMPGAGCAEAPFPNPGGGRWTAPAGDALGRAGRGVWGAPWPALVAVMKTCSQGPGRGGTLPPKTVLQSQLQA